MFEIAGGILIAVLVLVLIAGVLDSLPPSRSSFQQPPPPSDLPSDKEQAELIANATTAYEVWQAAGGHAAERARLDEKKRKA